MSPQLRDTALPGHGTLEKVAQSACVPPGGTETVKSGFSLHCVLEAETVPSSPLPPDMCSAVLPGAEEAEVQSRVWLEDEIFVYVA